MSHTLTLQAPTDLIAAAFGSGKVSLAWSPPQQPSLFESDLLFRISVAPLLQAPAAAAVEDEAQQLQAAGPFSVLSEVRHEPLSLALSP